MMQLVIGQTALRAMQEDRQKVVARTAAGKAQAKIEIEASARKGHTAPGEKVAPAKERAKAKARRARARRQKTQGLMPRVRALPLAVLKDRASLD